MGSTDQSTSLSRNTSTTHQVCTLRDIGVLDSYPIVNFFDGLNYLGVPTVLDPNTADSAGATYLPLDISPTNQTRADARRSYYEPFSSRPNFFVSTGQYVTNLIFETDPCANNNNTSVTGNEDTGQGSAQGQPPVGSFGSSNSSSNNFLSGQAPPPARKRKRQSTVSLQIVS